MEAQEIIEKHLGIKKGSDKFTPIDYGECQELMELYAKAKLEEAYKNIYMTDIFFEKLDLEDLKLLKSKILFLKTKQS